MLPNTCFIVGGGPSLEAHYHDRLRDIFKSSLVVGTNYSYKFFQSDLHAAIDEDFYAKVREDLATLPLVATRNRGTIKAIATPNSLLFPTSQNVYFGDDSLKQGVYTNLMCGAFALTLAIWLYRKVAQPAQIYLLGFDFGGLANKTKTITHFYQADPKLHHAGIGRVKFYNFTKPREFWKPFATIGPGISISNVSLISKIPVFEKISYEDMFLRVGQSAPVDHTKLPEEIKSLLSSGLGLV